MLPFTGQKTPSDRFRTRLSPERTKRPLESLDRKKFLRYGIAAVLLGILGAAVLEWIARLRYEAAGPYTWDTTIYWAVGRGILNGLVPWRDLWETKPPGIFLLSALSLRLFGGTGPTHLVQVGAIVFIAVSPALALIARKGTGWLRDPRGLFVLWLSLALGILYSLYAAERSGEVQVESLGAAALCAYLVAAASAKNSAGNVLLSCAALLAGCGLKEPFLPIAFAMAIVLLDSARSLLYRFFLPLGIALAVALAALAAAGWSTAFFGDYLPFMLHSRVGSAGSAFARGLFANLLEKDLDNFAPLLGAITILVFAWFLASRAIRSDRKPLSLLFSFGAAFLSLYLSSFAVGLGGEYFNHHFAFAIPVYLSWLVRGLSDADLVPDAGKIFGGIAAAGIALFIAFPVLGMPDLKYEQRLSFLQWKESVAKSEANYVDAVLEASGRNRYMFIGTNGPQLYGWTRHSPQGPLFFQFPFWFGPDLPANNRSLLESIDRSDLLVFDSLVAGPMNPAIVERIRRDFTETPWPSARRIGRMAPVYRIFFRIGTKG